MTVFSMAIIWFWARTSQYGLFLVKIIPILSATFPHAGIHFGQFWPIMVIFINRIQLIFSNNISISTPKYQFWVNEYRKTFIWYWSYRQYSVRNWPFLTKNMWFAISTRKYHFYLFFWQFWSIKLFCTIFSQKHRF